MTLLHVLNYILNVIRTYHRFLLFKDYQTTVLKNKHDVDMERAGADPLQVDNGSKQVENPRARVCVYIFAMRVIASAT